MLAFLSLLGSASIAAAAQQHDVSSVPSLLPLLPVRFGRNKGVDAASSQPTIIVGHEPNAYGYTYPYSKYAALSPTLTRIKRELQLGEQQQQDAAAVEDEVLEHLVSLGDLVAELGNGHVQNVNDAQMKAATALMDDDVTAADVEEEDDFKRGIAAYQASVELYERAITFFRGEDDYEDVIGLLAGVSNIQMQLSELVMADPSLKQMMLGSNADGAAAAAAALPVPITSEVLSSVYGRALRHIRDAIQSYDRALELLARRGWGASAAAGFDEDWSVQQLELAYADASVRLGSQIVECYEQGLVDVVLIEDEKKQMDDEGKLQSTIVSMDGTTSAKTVQQTSSPADQEDVADDPLQIFGVNGERVLKLARESFEAAAAIYRRFEATAANAVESTDDRVRLADVTAAIGLVSLYLGDLTNSISMYENSIELYLQLESEGYRDHIHDQDGDISFIVADILYQLSDVLLQAGRYDECDSRYQHSMDKFSELAAKGLQRPPEPRMNKQSTYEDDHSLRLHEEALEDYYASLGGNSADVLDDFGSDGLDDPLYEADLLFNLGTIHLSQNNLDEALRHLTKAISLYEGNLEVNEEGLLADAYLNKAVVLFSLERYAESAATHEEAIEIYRISPVVDGGESEATSSFGSNGSRLSKIRDRLINLDDMVSGIRNSTQTEL